MEARDKNNYRTKRNVNGAYNTRQISQQPREPLSPNNPGTKGDTIDQ